MQAEFEEKLAKVQAEKVEAEKKHARLIEVCPPTALSVLTLTLPSLSLLPVLIGVLCCVWLPSRCLRPRSLSSARPATV